MDQLPPRAREAIYNDPDLLSFLQLLADNSTEGIIFTDGPKRGYFPDEGVFVSTDHLAPSNNGGAGKDLRSALREAFALDIPTDDERAGA